MYRDIAKEIAKKLIEYDNTDNENYLPLLNRFIDEYNINKMDDRNKIIMEVVQELSHLNYEIISTIPFKIKNIYD